MLDFCVAGHLFRIFTVKEEAMRRRMGNYAPFAVDGDGNGTPLFSLSMDNPVGLPDEEPLQVYTYDLTEDSAELRIYRGRYILSITSAATGVEFLMDCPYADNPGALFTSDLAIKGIAPPPHIVDHMLVFAFSLAAARCQTLIIHSSTVVNGGRAVMFLGESGTGKSTHSGMWLENIPGTHLLNDDGPVVRVGEGAVMVYGSPWSGKTPCYLNESYPLAACVRIRQAPFNKAQRLTSLAAFGALLPSCLPTLQQREDMLDLVCSALSGVLAVTPVYTMDCLPDADAARVCFAGVLSE